MNHEFAILPPSRYYHQISLSLSVLNPPLLAYGTIETMASITQYRVKKEIRFCPKKHEQAPCPKIPYSATFQVSSSQYFHLYIWESSPYKEKLLKTMRQLFDYQVAQLLGRAKFLIGTDGNGSYSGGLVKFCNPDQHDFLRKLELGILKH